VGTYGYMPPEQFGDRTVPASDLYSLGATLITLATGTHPADLPQTDLAIKFEQAANLSPVFADWLRWMTEPSLNKRLTSALEALKALENEQQRSSSTVGVKKPSGSQVTLTKNAYSLEIITRSIRVGIRRLPSGQEYFLLLAFATFISPALRRILEEIFGNLAYLLTILSLAIWVLFPYLWDRFKRVRLHIDREQLYLRNEIFGFKWKLLRPTRRQDILLLNRTTKVAKLPFVKQVTINVNPGIILWVGTKKIEIGGDGRLTEPEIDWLAQELSDYLGMPITKEIVFEESDG
jgi:serine/threonine protein kinase